MFWEKHKVWLISVVILFIIAFFLYFIGTESALGTREDKTLGDVLKDNEMKKEYGGVLFYLGEPINVLHNLTMNKTVKIKGREVAAYIYIWKPWKDIKAPKKGWLTMENPFYRISVNLDHSYYMLFDKIGGRDVFVYNDDVEDRISILTGSDIGAADHGGDNPTFFATTALHDVDGISGYIVAREDNKRGFLLVNTEGWNFQPEDRMKGYDVEAEVMFGLFADRPYFIEANEFNNLQRLGLAGENIPYKDPDELVKTWVITGEYDSAAIKGGDLGHLNAEWWRPWYEVQTISGKGRKPFHIGSAAFSKMFPVHRIIGQKLGGGIIFSLPEGRFRFDETLGIYGDQVVGESILELEKPQKAFAFSVLPVNEYYYFYDSESFNEEYRQSMIYICERYGLTCPDDSLDWHNWKTKRFAYVLTLTSDWYDESTNKPKERVWELADQGLRDFKDYEDIIYEEMEDTSPVAR